MFKFKYLQIIPITIIFLLSINLFLGGRNALPFEYFTKQIIASWYPSYDNENKLKFVTTNSDEWVVGAGERLVKPVDVLGKKEKDGFIILVTHEKSAVVCPIDAKVSVDLTKKVVTIIKSSLRVEFYGFEIIGVQNGQKVKCGQPLGTLSGNELSAKVYLGKRAMSLSEIKALL